MENVGSSKLKNSLNSYLKKVKSGARFVITERNRPVARLVPIEDGNKEDPQSIMLDLLGRGLISIENPSPEFKIKLGPIIATVNGKSASSIVIEDREK